MTNPRTALRGRPAARSRIAARTMQGAHLAMGALFTYAVAVQYNDPDPFAWMPIYGAAAILCGLAARERFVPWLCLVLLVGSLGWAIESTSHVDFGRPLLDTEEGREMGGLFMTAGWMLVVFIHGLRHRLAALARKG